MSIHSKTNKFQVICPICKTSDVIGIPESRLKKTSPLTTISIHKGLICPHHFQFFLDKSFRIRGYQKVDLELQEKSTTKLRNGIKIYNDSKKESTNNTQNLFIDGDKLNSTTICCDAKKKIEGPRIKIETESKVMNYKEIYEEFWEFIDETNEIFLSYIKRDKRRPNCSINSELNELCLA
jgi:hypothetical protein